ncbi:MAG: hypothetical protein BWX80_04116 [Candidatus Hydrogenedentes bacterium ADurb.Bin101]|nr:MAG: hypothetical protein BWX80_04116 [Candidatus Hydrogenedentes bacterium ADurb.Bin101]
MRIGVPVLLEKGGAVLFAETAADIMGRRRKAEIIIKENNPGRGGIQFGDRFGVHLGRGRMHAHAMIPRTVGAHARLPGQIGGPLHVIRRSLRKRGMAQRHGDVMHFHAGRLDALFPFRHLFGRIMPGPLQEGRDPHRVNARAHHRGQQFRVFLQRLNGQARMEPALARFRSRRALKRPARAQPRAQQGVYL